MDESHKHYIKRKKSDIKGHILYVSRIGKSTETETRLAVARVLGGREDWGVTANGCGISFWGDEIVWN